MKIWEDLRLCSKNVNHLVSEWVREFVASREAIASKNYIKWLCYPLNVQILGNYVLFVNKMHAKGVRIGNLSFIC